MITTKQQIKFFQTKMCRRLTGGIYVVAVYLDGTVAIHALSMNKIYSVNTIY